MSMILVGFLILALILMATIRFSVFEIIQPWTVFLHNSCLDRLPHESFSLGELQALVCGENFNEAIISDIYKSTGLIHLFVVSGAHLIVIEKFFFHFFSRTKKNSDWILFLLLFGYAAVCDLNPPVTRSLISLIVSFLAYKNHLFWPDNFKIFMSGLLTLIFQPAWLSSVSLQLSWLAALVMSINSLYLAEKNIFWRQSFFFLFLAPLLAFFQSPNPLTIFINLIFTPVLEFFLFPLGLLVWLIPPLYVGFDFVISILRSLLKAFEIQGIPQLDLNSNYLATVGWTLILALQFYLHFKELDHRKDTYV